MASLNFDGNSIVFVVFCTRHWEHQSNAGQLVQFDADLQQSFGTKLHDILTEDGMDPDVHNRSVVLGCRPHVGGGTNHPGFVGELLV